MIETMPNLHHRSWYDYNWDWALISLLALVLLAGVAGTLVGCTNSGPSTTNNLPPPGSPVIVVDGTANGGVVVPLNLTINITN